MGMSAESIAHVRHALQNAAGDNTWRAKAQFRHYTQEQMDKEYGQSGKTPRQILAEYEAYDAKHNKAVSEFDALVK